MLQLNEYMFRSQNAKSENENGTAEDKQKQKVKEHIAVYDTNKLSADENIRERYQQEIVKFIKETQYDTSKSWDLKLMRNGPIYSEVWHPRKMMGHVKTAKNTYNVYSEEIKHRLRGRSWRE